MLSELDPSEFDFPEISEHEFPELSELGPSELEEPVVGSDTS